MKKVPFYSNLSDNNHCFEAGVRMVLKYFIPERNFTWKEIEKLTGKKKGLWTWSNRAMVSLVKLGFTIVGIQDFDIEDFAKRGQQTLIEIFGETIANQQMKHSNIPYEQEVAKEYIQYIHHQRRIPTFVDMHEYLTQGYLVGCNINIKILNGLEGYVGHFVVLYRASSSSVWLHDPGLPPRPNRRVSLKVFERAWGHPNEKAKNIIAFRL